jgi:hypothetical protein
MPTDPKWRTIARISKQPISLVISVYVTLLCASSRNVTRGHADVTLEDIASQLDVTEEEISVVFEAMQGRVLDGFRLTGWEKRQPKREDCGSETGAKSASERKRAQREREKEFLEKECHAPSRNVTTDKDKDKDKDINTNVFISEKSQTRNARKSDIENLLSTFGIDGQLAKDFIQHRKHCGKDGKAAPITQTCLEGFQREAGKAGIDISEAIRISIERNWQGFRAVWDWKDAITAPVAMQQKDHTAGYKVVGGRA